MKIKLLAHKELAYETMGFIFDKPHNLTFKAGQAADFTLINPPETDAEGNTRTFSLCNPPSAHEIMIATRMRDTAFKRVLKNMHIGTAVEFKGPTGSFTLHNKKSKAAVFLTGGIGITPVRSIVLQAMEDSPEHHIYLFYGNNSMKETAFLEELTNLQRENPNYKFIPTMAKAEANWKGEVGFVTEDMVRKYVDITKSPIYYMCGPAPMVVAMRKMLNDMGVNDDDIRSEEFSGY